MQTAIRGKYRPSSTAQCPIVHPIQDSGEGDRSLSGVKALDRVLSVKSSLSFPKTCSRTSLQWVKPGMFASTINVSKYLRINFSLFQTKDDSDTETLELAVVNGLGPILSLTIANSLNVAVEAYGDRSFYAQFWF